MRIGLLALLIAVLLIGSASAQYHDSKYLFGGYGSTSSLYAMGPWLADAGNQTFTQLGPAGKSWYYAYGMTMDVDNKKVIVPARGTTSTSYNLYGGIYRVDPATRTVITVFRDPNLLYTPGAVHVNQDGDYVFANYSRVVVSSATQYHYSMMKVPSLGGSISTLLATTSLGWSGTTSIYQGGQIDINTGQYIVQLYNTGANVRYGLLNLSLDGSTLTTWSTGGTYGLYGSRYDCLLQDWDAGDWKALYGEYLYQLKPGTMNRTTLWNMGGPGSLRFYNGTSKFDLRSAPTKRAMFGAYNYQTTPTTYYAPLVCAVDLSGPPYTVTAVNCDPQQKTAPSRCYPYSFHFYRGRHIQTLKGAPGKWQLLLSFPNYPGKSYVAAVSISGYKPPIKLNDGRKIYLRPDTLTQPSMNGWLAPIFYPGPGKLDANGEAKGSLDFTKVPLTGIPLWIAVAVLDPKAPGGVAYLPDTYVFRTP